jgi:hypothetical protein
MGKTSWLSAVAFSLLGCGSLFGSQDMQAPTTAVIDPTVSFPSALDCSNGGASPISVSWDVKPITLDNNTLGTSLEFSTQEILSNTGGDTTDCYYSPSSSISDASGDGLRTGLWQITMTHSISGYPNPVICTKQLVAGTNSIAFIIEPTIAGCQ